MHPYHLVLHKSRVWQIQKKYDSCKTGISYRQWHKHLMTKAIKKTNRNVAAMAEKIYTIAKHTNCVVGLQLLSKLLEPFCANVSTLIDAGPLQMRCKHAPPADKLLTVQNFFVTVQNYQQFFCIPLVVPINNR